MITHPQFLRTLAEVEEAERDRKFCRHGLDHLLAVARLGWIICRREKIDCPEELLYAAALLHDLGRCAEYQMGIPHDLAGIPIAREILGQCGFTQAETEAVCEAIAHHGEDADTAALTCVLHRADRESRNCFCCPAAAECRWTEAEKNHLFQY